jgi:predicted phosphodiesterase
VKIVAISDTHGLHRKLVLPPGDVLVHAGDITPKGETHIVLDFAEWLAAQPFRHKIVIAGNHDYCLDISRPSYDGLAVRVFEERGIHYLFDSSRVLDGVKFYGAPWCPRLSGWAFFDREQDQFEHAPRDIDVLVTHAPPHGIRDDASDESHFGSRHIVRYINRCARLKLHIFGHVHAGYGESTVGSVKFVNAASLADRVDNTLNAPMTIDYDALLRESGVVSTT